MIDKKNLHLDKSKSSKDEKSHKSGILGFLGFNKKSSTSMELKSGSGQERSSNSSGETD